MTPSVCALIAVYNNYRTIKMVVQDLFEYVDFVIVVNDGSDDGTTEILNDLAVANNRIDLVHMPYNQGKGAASQCGFHRAKKHGFSYAILVDGDGQHNLCDIPRFLEAANSKEGALIVGAPVFDDDIPFIRKHGRKLTDLMVALEMGMVNMPDGNCGFRAYPVRSVCALGKVGNRMDFDPDVLVRAYWAGVPIVPVPTKVRYLTKEEGGISHFRMVRDNMWHIWLHLRLLPQAPFRLLFKWLRHV